MVVAGPSQQQASLRISFVSEIIQHSIWLPNILFSVIPVIISVTVGISLEPSNFMSTADLYRSHVNPTEELQRVVVLTNVMTVR